MARIRDETGYGYEDIKKALRDIIEDNGKENHALAKKIETVIDDMLVEGYVNIVGENIKPNIRYIQMRNRLDPTKIKIPELEGANPGQLNQQMIMGIDQQKSMFESNDAFDDFLVAFRIRSKNKRTIFFMQSSSVWRPYFFAIFSHDSSFIVSVTNTTLLFSLISSDNLTNHSFLF